MAIDKWGFFSVPNVVWYRASVYNGHIGGSATITTIAERFEVELPLPVLTS